MLRFLLLKFLPRRVLPLLLLYEAFKVVRRMRGQGDMPVAHPPVRDDRIIEGRAIAIPTPEDAVR